MRFVVLASGACAPSAVRTSEAVVATTPGRVVRDANFDDSRLPGAGAVDRVQIAGGLVQVGRAAGDEAFEERPARAVRVRAFAIDRHEVDGASYGRCVTLGRCRAPSCDRGSWDGSGAVRCVTADDAAAYCAWTGGRLPSEAEWERAAAGPLPGHRAHPWGDDASGDDTTAEGVVGLGRGVAEWVADGGGFYLAPAVVADAGVASETAEGETAGAVREDVTHGLPVVDNAVMEANGAWRIARGGSDGDRDGRPTSSRRRFRRAYDRLAWIGFRCASSVGIR